MPYPHPSHHANAARSHTRLIGDKCARCLYCHSLRITREGKRYKKLEILQLWRCHDCNRVFTPQIVKGKTFPLAVILEALMRYYRGDTRERVAVHIKERFGIRISPRTLSQWLAEYRELTTYARLRPTLLPHFRPHQLILSLRSPDCSAGRQGTPASWGWFPVAQGKKCRGEKSAFKIPIHHERISVRWRVSVHSRGVPGVHSRGRCGKIAFGFPRCQPPSLVVQEALARWLAEGER